MTQQFPVTTTARCVALLDAIDREDAAAVHKRLKEIKSRGDMQAHLLVALALLKISYDEKD